MVGTGGQVGDPAIVGEVYSPLSTVALHQTSVLEVQVAGEVDATTLTTTSVTLTDISSGYDVPVTVTREWSSPNSKIVVAPTELLESGHRVKLEVTTAVLFTDAEPVGPLEETWDVTAKTSPFLFFDTNWQTLITDRCAGGGAATPWSDGYDYTPGVVPQRDWLNTTEIGATAALTRTPNPYVGTPSTHELALFAWDQGAVAGDAYGLHKELSALQALAWTWQITGTTSYRDRLETFVAAWIDNFGPADQRYSGAPADAAYWAYAVVKLCMALDPAWDDPLAIDGPLKKRTAAWLQTQVGFLANEWAQTIQSDFSPSYLDQLINLAVYTVGRLLGDRRMRLWAYDASTKPTDWSDNARPFTYLWLGSSAAVTPLFDSAARYHLEDEQEALGTGIGFNESVQAAWVTALFMVQRTLDAEHDWDTVNSNGDTLEDVFGAYADYLDGTADWETTYPGHYLDDFVQWRASVCFGLPAAIYRTAKLNDIVADTWGSRTGPKAEDPIWFLGGNAAYWPAAAAIGADAVDPPDVTGASAPDKGATFIHYTWTHSANTDERDVVRYYRIYDVAVLVGTTREPDFVYSGLTPNTAYTVTIRAVDLAGNEAAGASVGPTTTDTV